MIPSSGMGRGRRQGPGLEGLVAALGVAALAYSLLVCLRLVDHDWTTVEARIEDLRLVHWTKVRSKSVVDCYAIRATYTWKSGTRLLRDQVVGFDGDEVWNLAEAERRLAEIRARQPPFVWTHSEGDAPVFLDPRLPTWTVLCFCFGLGALVAATKIARPGGVILQLDPDGLAEQLGSLGLAADLLGFAYTWVTGGHLGPALMAFLAILHLPWLGALAREYLFGPVRSTPAAVRRVPPAPGVGAEGPPGLVRVAPLPAPDAVRCPFCGDGMLGRTMVRCRRCQTLHHADCWQSSTVCTTYACGSTAYDRTVVDAPGSTRQEG